MVVQDSNLQRKPVVPPPCAVRATVGIKREKVAPVAPTICVDAGKKKKRKQVVSSGDKRRRRQVILKNISTLVHSSLAVVEEK